MSPLTTFALATTLAINSQISTAEMTPNQLPHFPSDTTCQIFKLGYLVVIREGKTEGFVAEDVPKGDEAYALRYIAPDVILPGCEYKDPRTPFEKPKYHVDYRNIDKARCDTTRYGIKSLRNHPLIHSLTLLDITQALEDSGCPHGSKR